MDEQQIFLSIREVSKHFGPVRALDGISMDIRQGEFFALLGASGCGKTTLLRILGGFEFPTAGTVYMDGSEITAVPANKRPVNMVFQNYAIFPHLNVRQNIAYGLRQAKLPRAELDAKLDEALRKIKLEGYGERSSNELSGGERQRVALARALVKQPKVLLLDEPLSALDKNLREQMRVELRSLQKSLGITFVFVTHDQEEALSMADRIAVMSAGKVLQVDTPERLYEVPASREVAEFIGTMNFFHGRVRGTEGDIVIVDAGPLGSLRIAGQGRQVAPGNHVVVGIRPEKLVLNDRQERAEGNAIRGRLGASSYLGDRSHFYVEIDGLDRPFSVASTNDLPHKATAGRMTAGAEVWLTWAPDGAIILSDDQTP